MWHANTRTIKQPVSQTREAVKFCSGSTRRPQTPLGFGPETNNIVSGFPIFGTGFTPKTLFCIGFDPETSNFVRVRLGPGQ